MWKNTRKGRCVLCGAFGLVERHHVLYRPEKTLDLCHSCHFRVHYKPWELKEGQIFILLSKKCIGTEIDSVLKTQEEIKKHISSYAHSLSLLAQARHPLPDIAPSRKEQGWSPRERLIREGIEERLNKRKRERACGGGARVSESVGEAQAKR